MQSSQPNIRVAFSGSGFLAGIHAGAASAILDSGYNIVEVAGTSGGSIVAAAVACGLKKQDLYHLSVESDMSELLEFTPVDILTKGVYCDGKNLYNWLDNAFSKKTLSQTSMKCTILATDVANGASFVFGTNETPSVPLALACRASSAVPFVYEPVMYDGKFLTDGGMINNLPVDKLAVDSTSSRIGIDVGGQSTYATSPIWTYAGSLIHIMLNANESTLLNMEKATGAKIVSVSPGDVNFLDTHMTIAQKDALFKAGYSETIKALQK